MVRMKRLKAFGSLSFGEVAIDTPQLYIGDVGVFETLGIAEGPAMVLGVDLLSDRRVLIDYPGQQLVIPSGGKPPAPDAFKPPSSSSLKSYGSSARSSAGFDPARLVEGKGLGLVTAGAFFIALAVGIAAFKEDPYKRPRDTRGDDGGYDDRGYDDQAGAPGYGQQLGYYDQYNRGEWQQYEGTWSSRPATPPTDRGEQYPGQGNPNIW